MADLMTFPDTVEEFMERYKVTDTEQVYTNGAELVPIFRMKQWFEHLPTSEPTDEDVKKYCRRRNLAIVAREDFPILSAEPREGKWIKNDGRYGWHCSVCGEDDLYAFVQDSDTSENELQDHYCPFCGTRMEESE